MILTHGPIQYEIDRIIANSNSCRFYICRCDSKQYLLQIASSIENNGGLDRAAYILKELKDVSDFYETEYSKICPDKKLSYDHLFPKLIDSFISSEQGERRINILELADIDIIEEIIPLSNLLIKDKMRISLETSGWIFGRLLKLLDFIHSQNIPIDIHGHNILIVPEKHRTIILDWSEARIYQGEITDEICKNNISRAAMTIFTAIGGDAKTGIYPYDTHNVYVDFIWKLTEPIIADAGIIHQQFYKIVDNTFGKVFYPFGAFPL